MNCIHSYYKFYVKATLGHCSRESRRQIGKHMARHTMMYGQQYC